MALRWRVRITMAAAVVIVVAALAGAVTRPAAAQGDDGRVNPFGGLGAPVAIYYEDGMISVYVITPESTGEHLFTLTAELIDAAGIPAEDEEPVILWEDMNPYGNFEIVVSRLSTGEFKLYTRKHAAFNPPDDTEPYIAVWLTSRSDAYTLKQ